MWRTIFLLALIGLCPAVSAQDKATTTRKLNALHAEIQTLNADLAKNKTSKSQLYAQLKQQSRRISSLSKALYELKHRIAVVKQQLTVLQQQSATQHSAQKLQIDALDRQIRSAYLQSQPTLLKILLNQTDPATLARRQRYFYYFNQARQQQLQSIAQTLAQLERTQQEYITQQHTLQSLYQQQQEKQAQLKQQLKQRQITLAVLDKKIASQHNRLTQLKQQAQVLQSLLNSLNDKATQPTDPHFSFVHSSHRLPWPLTGKLLARYGQSRNIGKLRWQGILIGAPAGTAVKAVAPGKVVFADWLRGFGLLMIIDHGHQYMSLYGYNKALLKQAGDIISTGDMIALSGDKGSQRQSGLYFEVRYKGSPTNPLKWLRKQDKG